MQCLFVYITTSNVDEARKIARTVVERKLAACANILPQMNSLYWWEGKIEESTESVLILKTTEAQFNELEGVVKESHCYSNPCVIALPIKQGSTAYLEWLENAVCS